MVYVGHSFSLDRGYWQNIPNLRLPITIALIDQFAIPKLKLTTDIFLKKYMPSK